MVPFRNNPGFVGREEKIAKIEKLITQQDGPGKIATCGLGGVGKTQIELKLAYYIRVQYSSDAQLLTDFLPQSEQGRILFTTRNRKLAVKLVSQFVIHVSEPDPETSVKILEKALVKKDLLNDSDATITLLNQLAFLPLAIYQAAAYINENNIEPSEYITLLRNRSVM
ncbi:uncharacterized protein ATNIH1004_011367 [Aspergillus tanneri]|uniref:NB-ARC domain-containing protein n=1 Tax=Aspergillus tanneri TaxID=1220188 RepID=A0A5M9MBX5_9EURO|nr:uncharacterized protein ATNIH1004_011367 [Aspergillus tanneri]KAA8642423.1 hypothetical protein ATNIH1004_011367 [Aspergillus tanneri]